MKKLIFKTALITLGIMIILGVSVFGIASFVAPAAMMRFFDSMGFESISGDYAYQHYQISNDLNYLARSFEIAAAHDNAATALQLFNEFYGEEGSAQRERFDEYCKTQTGSDLPEAISDYNYRAYVCGRAAVVKYRLAVTDEDKAAVCVFAISESDAELTAESPVVALSVEIIEKRDTAFCAMFLGMIKNEKKFNKFNQTYTNILNHLEEASNE